MRGIDSDAVNEFQYNALFQNKNGGSFEVGYCAKNSGEVEEQSTSIKPKALGVRKCDRGQLLEFQRQDYISSERVVET